MEIAPIPGIRALPAIRAPQKDFRPLEVFDIEGTARPGDRAGQRSGRKAAGAEENDESDLMLDGEPDAGIEEDEPARQVDLFA
jgi:hypothetical protein